MIATAAPSRPTVPSTGRESAEPCEAGGRATMTVAICTRDRADSLLRCVRSVVAQSVVPAELIVVDDGRLSPQDRDAIARTCLPAGVRPTILHKTKPGLPGSRNLAVRHARGDVVLFLDDDVELDADFCRRLAGVYELDATGAVVGVEGVLVDAVPSVAARLFGLVYRIAGWWSLRPKDVCRRPLPRGLRDPRWAVPVSYLSGACMSFRRSVLERYAFDEGLGGYALGEDRELSLRISREGRLLHVRGAVAVHRHDPAGRPDHFAFGRMTVLNYVRSMRRIGRGSLGDAIVIAYTFGIIGSALAICSLLRPRRYLAEFLGLLSGLGDVLLGRTPHPARPGPVARSRLPR